MANATTQLVKWDSYTGLMRKHCPETAEVLDHIEEKLPLRKQGTATERNLDTQPMGVLFCWLKDAIGQDLCDEEEARQIRVLLLNYVS